MKFKYINVLAGKKISSLPMPIIEIGFPGKNARAFCLVDSGAEDCFFPAVVGDALGFNVEEGKEKQITGITGNHCKVYFHKMKYEIGGWEFETEIGFSRDFNMPFGILGREGFFNFFKVCFNHKKKEIELKQHTKK